MDFAERVYALVKQIPEGRVTTYKEAAAKLGTGAFRAVGSALRRNPNPVKVPCHRVVNSNGNVGGYLGAMGGRKKEQLLKNEGVRIKCHKIEDFNSVFFRFS